MVKFLSFVLSAIPEKIMNHNNLELLPLEKLPILQIHSILTRLNIVNQFLFLLKLIFISLISYMYFLLLSFYNSRRYSHTFKKIEQIENKTKNYSNDFLHNQSISQTKELFSKSKASFKKTTKNFI